MRVFALEIIETLLKIIVNYAILLFEYIGVGIIVFTGLKSFISYLKKDSLTGLNLAKGMAMGLEFKLGSEILRTVIVHDNAEILTVAFIIALRAALTFIIHWEIAAEEKSHTNNPCG